MNDKDSKLIVNIEVLLKRRGKDKAVELLDELLQWADADLNDLLDFNLSCDEIDKNVSRLFKLKMAIRTYTEEDDSDDTERGTRNGS